ncbi:hypothetical protein ABZX75_17465 [Streptomyces sp. NPDC003038]|uniref:hypothetical protein n=1 Tax=unclassified Streptomyces TaxID=2593676 RepID=UPI0033A62FB9
MALTDRRWKIRYSYPAPAEAWWARDGLEKNTTYLNNGEEKLTPEEAAAIVAREYRHEGPLTDITVWQETPEERDRRLAAQRKAEADERNGIWWGMGGAN